MWVGIKLQEKKEETAGYHNYVSNSSLTSLERSESVEEIQEKRRKRRNGNPIKLDEVFKK